MGRTSYLDWSGGLQRQRHSGYPLYMRCPEPFKDDLVVELNHYRGSRHENPRDSGYESKWEGEADLRDYPMVWNYLVRAFKGANRRYQFVLSGLLPVISVFEYKRGDRLGQHLDFNYQAVKLSSITRLAGEYKGGELLIGPQRELVPLAVGETIVFPSWQVHEVRPILSGCRRVMANWAVGPRFR